jgi:Rrf2 family protein
MRLTRASSYALYALANMARQKPGTPVASHTIAREHGIPERFLLKVLNPLVSAGILSSLKGPHGGYRLARSASDITLLEVIEAVEGPIRGEAPPPESEDREKYPNYKPANNEPLYHKLEAFCKQAAEHLRKTLKKVKLSELIEK